MSTVTVVETSTATRAMPSSCSAERSGDSTLDTAVTAEVTTKLPRPKEKLSAHPYSYVAAFTACAQAAGLIAAYALGFAYHYESLTRTHCRVPNFWPSISKATGDHLPGRYAWRLAISLTTFPRMMEALLYYNYFASQKPQLFQKWWYRWLNRINFFFMVMELFLFYTVTFVSSKEHMDMHIYTWMAFLAFSMSHMVTFLVLYGWPSRQRGKTRLEKISLVVRFLMLAMQVIAVMTFFHFGKLHIWECVPYSFSYAAISECVIAASNLGFQSMQLLDFHTLRTSTHWGSDKLKMT